MKILRLTLLWLCLLTAPGAFAGAPFADGGPWVARAYYQKTGQLNWLAARTAPWEVNQAEGYAVIEIANKFERDQFIAFGLRLEVDDERTALIRKPTQPLAKGAKSIPGYACYRTVEETQATIAQMVAAAPRLAEVIDIGDSWEKIRNPANGYDLRVLKLTNRDIPGPKPRFFAMSSVHAREYTPAELMTRFAEELLNGYGTDPDATWILDHQEVHLLLQANPDGRKRAETALSWRKNTNEAFCSPTSNSRGADLNRNFPFGWAAYGGSSAVQCDSTYRGPSASSEPETQAITAYVRSIFDDNRGPNLLDPAPFNTPGLFFDVHSFSQLVLWPYGFDSDPLTPGNQGSANDAAMRTLGRRFAWFNSYMPQQAVELYVTDGTTLDFAYGELGVAAYTFELGRAFFEPCASFESTVLPDNLRALRYAMKVTRAPYQLPAGPEVQDALGSLLAPGEPVFVAAQVDDSRLSVLNGSEPAQNIAAAQLYVDQLPWTPGAVPNAGLSALDGLWDSSRERVWIRTPLALPIGRHLVYLQGRDSGNANGPLSAAFVTVADPKTTARISGVVRDARNAEPLKRNSIVSSGRLGTASNLLTSSFSLRLQPRTQTVTASAPGFLDAQSSPLALSPGSSTTQDFSLVPVCPAFRDLLDGDTSGWTAQTPWATTTARSFSAPRSFTDSPAGNYANNANTALLSPLLSTLGFEQLELRFASYCAVAAGADFGRVDLSIDGGASFSEIWRCNARPSWEAVKIALPTATNRQAVQLRLRLTSDAATTAEGWYIDDVQLLGGSLSCPFGGDELIFADGFSQTL